MTLNTTVFNWMSRLVLGTATVITLGGMAPEVVQANSTRGTVSEAMFQKGVNGESHQGAIAQLDDMLLQIAEPFFNSATEALNNEDFERAITFYEMAISMHSDYAEAYAGRALARAGLGDRNGTI